MHTCTNTPRPAKPQSTAESHSTMVREASVASTCAHVLGATLSYCNVSITLLYKSQQHSYSTENTTLE